MEHGPVDAGPADSEYDGAPSRAYSPDQERFDLSKRGGLRSASSRPSAAAQDGSGNSQDKDLRFVSSGHRRPGTSDSADSVGDAPLYPRVGATAEEAAGEVCVDDESHMKDDPAAHEVTDADSRPHKMFKFTLYETNARYWITGGDITHKYFRLLRIDRTSPPGQITLFEDETVYNRDQIESTLNRIREGNKVTGGLRMKTSFWGLLGFIRFTEAYYMLLITKRKQAAMIGGHYVYQVEATEMVPLTTGPSSSFIRDRNADEARFLSIMNNVDLSKSFYFSYSYDITNSLQNNIIRQRRAISEGRYHAGHDYNGMFVWNHHLLKAAVTALKHPYDWCLPITHGFLDQRGLDIFGRTIYVTVIGRRSRFFAGARFLKRGVNDLGYVANDVETEQIVAEKITTSFHAPGPRLYSNPTYTSFVQHRGSIPLYWTQDSTGVAPKPGIEINVTDPFYEAAALHFDNLFERYGCPVYVLNLVKAREKVPREQKLLHAFQYCIEYLNQSLPEDKQILYKAYDMARAAKTRHGNVIEGLEVITKQIVDKIGFFHNGQVIHQEPQVQNGVARTNCIDCLDRTNAAQFVIAKDVFALQLQKLGVIDTDEVAYDTDAVRLFTEMFHNHGDNIAMQYGGSHLVNTMATYRKLNHWQSSSRDTVESFKRYYHNTFLDAQRQEAYNLFLGNYIWVQGQPMLWDLPTDFYLHHSDPRAWFERNRRHYINWYTPEFLRLRVMPLLTSQELNYLRARKISEFDDYWRECYRPNTLSSLQKVYSYRMASTQSYLTERPHIDGKPYDFSPFVPRVDTPKQIDSPDKPKPQRKGVKIVDPHEDSRPSLLPPPAFASAPENHRQSTSAVGEDRPSILRERTLPTSAPAPRPSIIPEVKPLDKNQQHLWTLGQFHAQSLHPSVSTSEAREYGRYVAHPLALPLVVSSELPSDANIDYVEYVHKISKLDDGGVEGMGGWEGKLADADRDAYREYVAVKEEPLTVTESDGETRRYKAYRQWLRGRSLFKTGRGDGES